MCIDVPCRWESHGGEERQSNPMEAVLKEGAGTRLVKGLWRAGAERKGVWDLQISWGLAGKAQAGDITERQLWACGGGGSVCWRRGHA